MRCQHYLESSQKTSKRNSTISFLIFLRGMMTILIFPKLPLPLKHTNRTWVLHSNILRKSHWTCNYVNDLKGQCHEYFAVLHVDQFWAKIITLRLYSLTKCFCKATTKISNEIYQRGLKIIKFLRIFWRSSIKIWKNWQFFSNFNPFPYLPSEATGDRKQFQCLQIVLHNKPRPLVLEFSWCKDT